jgi:hypothetical protein
MSDYEMLELLAAQAPAPQPGHTDRVLAQARRTRLRHRVLGAGAAGAVVVALSVGAALVAPDRDRTPPFVLTPATAAAQTSAEAPAYVAAVRALAERVRGTGPRWRVLYVLDHTCANVLRPTGGTDCDPRSLPEPLRRELTAGLAGYAPVIFVADAGTVTGPDLTVRDGGAVVRLGPIRLAAAEAEVPLSVQHAGLGGEGLTYRVVRRGAQWRVEGTVGSGWIS